MIKVSAWNNGSHSETGAGYGLKILSLIDRDKFFDESWNDVLLTLPDLDRKISVNIKKPSFWNRSCMELISQDIGKWFISNNLAPWPKHNPPQFQLEPIGKREFELQF